MTSKCKHELGFQNGRCRYGCGLRVSDIIIASLQAENERLEAENEILRGLLSRYRNETPLGHQPHMIAAVVDKALESMSDE